ncbi:MAG: 2-oxo acid dehydrogenase subunit E2 [Clostridiales Family XIII bacterium]|nr:2-oxo acid dehydrogenase subunit E2 [Clostridiales Family XIII bacterium]
MDEQNDWGMRIRSKEKLSSVRSFIGNKMSESLAGIPQASPYFEFETDALFSLKDRLKQRNGNVTFTSILARIMADVLRAYPLMNSSVVGGEFITYESCNVGIGVGLERGIMMIVIREAQDKDIFEISDEMSLKTQLLKENRLPISDMKGSTFTISSIGVQGIRYSTVIINPPETAMLAIGVSEKRVVVLDDESTAIRRVTGFTLSHSHVVMDGYHVGEAIRLMGERIRDPEKYMGF